MNWIFDEFIILYITYLINDFLRNVRSGPKQIGTVSIEFIKEGKEFYRRIE